MNGKKSRRQGKDGARALCLLPSHFNWISGLLLNGSCLQLAICMTVTAFDGSGTQMSAVMETQKAVPAPAPNGRGKAGKERYNHH